MCVHWRCRLQNAHVTGDCFRFTMLTILIAIIADAYNDTKATISASALCWDERDYPKDVPGSCSALCARVWRNVKCNLIAMGKQDQIVKADAMANLTVTEPKLVASLAEWKAQMQSQPEKEDVTFLRYHFEQAMSSIYFQDLMEIQNQSNEEFGPGTPLSPFHLDRPSPKLDDFSDLEALQIEAASDCQTPRLQGLGSPLTPRVQRLATPTKPYCAENTGSHPSRIGIVPLVTNELHHGISSC